MFRTITLVLIALLSTTTSLAQDDNIDPTYYFTYHQADGNRFVDGGGTFPNANVVDLPLVGLAFWVVGSPFVDNGAPEPPIWIASLDGGSAQITLYDTDGTLQITQPLTALSPGTPPVLVTAERTFLSTARAVDSSPLTHPVQVGQNTLYIALNGDIVLLDADDETLARLDESALPDARIVVNGDGLAAIYTGATNQRYVHGIMGDDLEATSLTIIDPTAQQIVTRIDLEGDEVFEGIAPMWADVDEDGRDDLIVTASFSGGGAQLRAYRVDGSLLAQSDPIGRSNRWRHQLAWGPFGADGENLLVEILTPHIGGITGFFAYEDGALVRVGRGEGFTSHSINSRNLDMAVAGDFDGDGQPEIVLPSNQRDIIGGSVLNADGEVETLWTLPLDGILTSNLAAVELSNGGLALAAAIANDDDYFLRVWLPMDE